MKGKVFLSCASEDKDFVGDLNTILLQNGLATWFYAEDTIPGKSPRELIDEAVPNADYGIAILGRTYFKKYWTREELKALDKLEEKGKRILIVLRGLTPQELEKASFTTSSKVWIDGNRSASEVASDILRAMEGRKPTSRQRFRMPAAPASRAVDALLVALCLYLGLAATLTTDEMLLRGDLALPFLNAKLPCISFLLFAPALLVLVHLYVLIRRPLAAELESMSGSDLPYIARVFSTSLLLGIGLLLPVMTLLLIQVRSLPYHSPALMAFHGILMPLDLAAVWLLWLRPSFRRATEQRTNSPSSLIGTVAIFGLAVFTSWTMVLPIADFPQEAGWPRRNLSLPGKRLVAQEPPQEVVSSYLARGRSEEEAWLHHAEGLHLAKRDLQYANFAGSTLIKVDLTGAGLMGATFREADLQGANLGFADLRGGRLRQADLKDAKLERADLRGADLRNANLRGADLRYARLEGAHLVGADLIGADLSSASLLGANLLQAQLTAADFSGADLRLALLAEARAQGADFRDANLSEP